MALSLGVAVVVALYFAREILLPLALSFLLSFLLAPLVKRIRRFPDTPGAIRIDRVSIAFGLACLLGYALVLQMYTLASNLPQYKSNIAAKLESLSSKERGSSRNRSRHSCGRRATSRSQVFR